MADQQVTPAGSRTRPARPIAAFAGAALLVLGVAGFIPGLTTNYSALAMTGPGSDAHLFGVFTVSVLGNIVHLVLGAAGVAAAARAAAGRVFLVVGGGVLILLGVFGLAFGPDNPSEVFSFNGADNWLHGIFGVVLILLAFVTAAVERARGQYPRDPMEKHG